MSTNFKSIKAERTTETRDIHHLEGHGTGNIFETIVALSKRSNQVALSMKKELEDKLEEFVIPTDSLEEVFENREQIEISKFSNFDKRLTKVVLPAPEGEDKIIITPSLSMGIKV